MAKNSKYDLCGVSGSSKQFVKIFISIFIGCIICITGINLMIDPFEIHQMPLISNFNKVKISLGTHERLHRAIEMMRKKPEGIFLGSSRILHGLSPDDLHLNLFTEKPLNVHNFAFSGANFEEIYNYFEHALYLQPDLKLVIIGLDFSAFNKHVIFPSDFCKERLNHSFISWEDLTYSLLSLDALKSSFETFKNNFFDQPLAFYLPNGCSNPIKDCIDNPILKKGELTYLKLVTEEYENYENDEKKIDLFRKLVKKCQDSGVTLKCFFCPAHAHYWETLYRKNLWESFEDLKRQLSAIHPIWDFSGFNGVTTQALESELEESFYLDCSHFRPFIGKIILEKIFNSAQNPQDFGFLLNSQTADSVLKKMRDQAEEWVKNHENLLLLIEQAPDWYSFSKNLD